ncbi:MAG: dockerin type I domain-containing protein [Ruminococcus flavefaciens]|nr:dockerin type I domain-containing protein [Ruminococcus flavefaciens]
MRFNKFVSVSVASLLACTIVPFSECVRTDLVVYAEDTAVVASDTLSMGDVNADGSVDAVDATLVLTEYARLSTGSDYSFSDSQIAVADVNSDGFVDAVDASLILAYYAYLSTGGTMSFESYNIYINSSSKDMYTAYLSQQKLCQVSKDCKILDSGAVTGNLSGLAGVVKHDFDGDGVDELVTFTFDKNSADGEDIRVDLLKVNGDELVVADSRYLTELADISSQPKDNTIYFDYGATTEIVTSEYNGNLYFGCLFSEVVNEFSRGGDSFGGFGIFTVENDKITKQSAGYDMAYVTSDEVCVSLLPPSIRNAEISDDLINEDSNIIAFMFSEFSPSTQGLYKSAEEARSAMTNEFGLDIETKDDYYTYNIPDYHWISADGSDVKTILNTEYILSFESMSSSFLNFEICYDGIKWILNSDLELLLNIDRNSFEDELALYEDILRYPSYHHDVWDVYTTEDYDTRYFVADITGDGLKELVIIGVYYTTNFQITIVKADNSVTHIEHTYGFQFHNNGFIVFPHPLIRNITQYFDVKTGEYWRIDSKDTEPIVYSEDDSEILLTGEEALQKIEEFKSGNILLTEAIDYSFKNPQNFDELVFVDDVSEIEYTWQKAYIDKINTNSNKKNLNYSLICIDDNDIPELILSSQSDSCIDNIYTYYDGAVCDMYTGGMFREKLGGYKEKGNLYYTMYDNTIGLVETLIKENNFYQIKDSSIKFAGFFNNDQINGTYNIDGEEVDEQTYNQRFEEITQGMKSAPETFTYDEIIEKLSSDTN